MQTKQPTHMKMTPLWGHDLGLLTDFVAHPIITRRSEGNLADSWVTLEVSVSVARKPQSLNKVKSLGYYSTSTRKKAKKPH